MARRSLRQRHHLKAERSSERAGLLFLPNGGVAQLVPPPASLDGAGGLAGSGQRRGTSLARGNSDIIAPSPPLQGDGKGNGGKQREWFRSVMAECRLCHLLRLFRVARVIETGRELEFWMAPGQGRGSSTIRHGVRWLWRTQQLALR